MRYKILNPKQKFRGRSYGQWAGEWWNWLMSRTDPDLYTLDDDMIFLRANIDYVGVGKDRHQTGTNYSQSITINKNAAIFFPIIECGVHYGHPISEDDDTPVTTESEMYNLSRYYMDPWTVFAAINDDPLPLYRVTSPLFKLVVSRDNKIRAKMEVPPAVGVWDCVTDGYWILIKSLPPGKHKIHLQGSDHTTGLFYSGTYQITVI